VPIHPNYSDNRYYTQYLIAWNSGTIVSMWTKLIFSGTKGTFSHNFIFIHFLLLYNRKTPLFVRNGVFVSQSIFPPAWLYGMEPFQQPFILWDCYHDSHSKSTIFRKFLSLTVTAYYTLDTLYHRLLISSLGVFSLLLT
jgi:hypothetical protein